MINIFAYTSSNRSGVGAIDDPDRFEQVFRTYHTGGKPRPSKGPPSYNLKNTFIVRISDLRSRNN